MNRKNRLLYFNYDDYYCGCNLKRKWASGSRAYGLFDADDRMLLPCAYDVIEHFSDDGYTWVSRDHRWGLVNTEGRFLINLQYEAVGSFTGGLCWVKKDGLWGRVDAQGHLVTPFTLEAHHAVMSFLVVEDEHGRYGAVDEKGQWVLPPEYDDIREQKLWCHGYACWSYKVYEGRRMALAVQGDRFWMLDDKGHKRFEEAFTSMYCQVRCDVFAFHTKNYAYRNNRLFVETYSSDPENTPSKTGIYDVVLDDFIAPCIYDSIAYRQPAFYFDNTYPYCVAHRDGCDTLLDMEGRETMPLTYEVIAYEPLADGEYLIPAYKDGLWGYINVEGVVKIPFRFRTAGQFANGRAEVRYATRVNGIDVDDCTPGHGQPVIIDRHGKVCIPAL